MRSAGITIIAYGYAAYAAYLVFSPGDLPVGYRYLILLVASLMLLAAHGLRLIRGSQIHHLFRNRQTLHSSPTDAVLAGWEILFGWLGVTAALVFLYYAAPAEQLEAWYPRLFLCLSVLFVAAFRRALIFLASILPFVVTITLLAFWQDILAGAYNEAAVKGAFLLLDGFLVRRAFRIAHAGGIFAINELEMPVGPGRVGERFSAFIRTQSSHFPKTGYQLDLTCVRQGKGSGRRATGEVLRHYRKTVRGDMPGARYSGCSVPVDFELPEDAPPTSASGDSRVTWTLRAAAELSDSAFSVVFEVPVEEAAPEPLRDNRERIDGGAGARPPHPAPMGVNHDGALMFKSGSDWNASGELLTMSYFGLWCQLVWLASMNALDLPALVMFGVGLAFLAGLLWPLRARVVTEFRDGVLRVKRRALLGSRRLIAEGPQVADVIVKRSGFRAGLIEACPYYDVLIQTDAGKRIVAGTQFRERRGAEAAAKELKAAAENPSPAASAGLGLELQDA